MGISQRGRNNLGTEISYQTEGCARLLIRAAGINRKLPPECFQAVRAWRGWLAHKAH